MLHKLLGMPLPNGNLAGLSVKRELYSRPPNWWTRFTWPITAGILIWTAVGAETFMTRWTRVVPKHESADSKDQTSSPRTDVPPSRELRPWNQRALASLLLFLSGTSLAVFFIQGRSYIIKQVDGIFVPTSSHCIASRGGSTANKFPSTSPKHLELRYLALKSFGAVGPRHRLIPKEQCEIVPTMNKNELKIRVNNESTYWLGLDGVKINGSEVDGGARADSELPYTRLVEALGLNIAGGKGQWKGGPVVRK